MEYVKQNIKKIVREFIPFLVVYLILDIVVVGSLFVCSYNAKHGGEDIISQIIHNFLSNITSFKFFTAFSLDFGGFLQWSFWVFLITIGFFIAWKIKFAKESEYDGIESGSSDWAKHGEEFQKTSDGRELLNRKSGFILSKDHYLGTDLKKVLINKNVLVVGRIWCR